MSILQIAESRMLAPSGLCLTDVQNVMGRLLGHQIDFGDLYFNGGSQRLRIKICRTG